MKFPDQLLLSDFLSHNVSSDQGIDHGCGVIAWMHPPVHRLLGWATRPSVLKLTRDVWRLNQLKAININRIYVKGLPFSSNQETLDRLPTLVDAQLLNTNNYKIGIIADLVFDSKTGMILYYLVSRSDPRIPGTSRWKLTIDRIKDQQPGIVISNINTLDDIPLIKSSIRQDLIKKSKNLRKQFQEISDKASDRLEGWLEESPWEEDRSNLNDIDSNYINNKTMDNWVDELNDDFFNDSNDFTFYRDSSYNQNLIEEEDPWV